MNEKQWLTAATPRAGLDYLCSDGSYIRAGPSANRRKAGRRKLRLFLCACARRVWGLIPPGPCRKAVGLGERLAEGEDVAARVAALDLQRDRGALSGRHAAHAAGACVEKNLRWASVVGADASAMAAAWALLEAEGGEDMRIYDRGKRAEERAQAALLREVFGNLFRPVAVDPRWLTSDVVPLARGIYAERAFDQLPILADALQEAGCANEAVLGHCRGPGPHVRGCWVVDLLLGKG